MDKEIEKERRMKEELIEKLYDSFELREREGVGGMKFKYIPANDVIDRMNKTFGGCWSTEVTSQERVDDFVVVRVKVSVYDPDGDSWFSHDGYGSSMVARYRGGNNQGQIIDLGNAYKSAEAKAIKNACTRWGVGLFMEAEDEESNPFGGNSHSSKSNNPPQNPTPTNTAPSNTASVPPPFPENNNTPPAPPAGVHPSVPDVPEPANNTSASKPEPKPEPKSEPETSPTPPTEPTTSTQNTDDNPGITDVQRVAIQGLLQIKAASFADIPENERFGKLAADALGRTDDLPKKIEDLSYQDAVTVIKYGNEIDKK